MPEFLFWAPILVQGMAKQELGRCLLPRPARIEADTQAAFSDDTPVDPVELASQFAATYLVPWKKELGSPASRNMIDSQFDELYPGRGAKSVLRRVLSMQHGTKRFQQRFNGEVVSIYKQVIGRDLVVMTLLPVMVSAATGETEDTGR